MTWIIPENKLDAQQRSFLDTFNTHRRNVWIKGFAGSGKSVLLAYAAKRIRTTAPSASVLLVVFTRSLVEMFKAAFKEMGLNISVNTYYGFMKSSSSYDYILCDEVQDLTPRVIREMGNRASHVIVAGDSNQSIYKSDPQWGEATVLPSEIGSLIQADSFELNIIHRLSRSIIAAVQRFLPHMNIFSSMRDMTKSDTQIRLCKANSTSKEVAYVMEQAEKAVRQGYTAAILIPQNKRIVSFVNQVLGLRGKTSWSETKNSFGTIDFGAMNSYLANQGVPIQYVGSGYGKFSENDRRVVIMTYAGSKGLDFDNVFIPYADSSLQMYINPTDDSLAKTLFMVAMTRAKENLYISYSGNRPCPYLSSIESNCSHIDIESAGNSNTTRSTSNNPWGF